MRFVQLRLRVRRGPPASATGRGGARREAGTARDWQDWPARSRVRLRARDPQLWGGNQEKTTLGLWTGLRGARFRSPLLLQVVMPASFPSSFSRGLHHLGSAPESTAPAPAPWPPPLTPPQGLFLGRGRAGSRGALWPPGWRMLP